MPRPCRIAYLLSHPIQYQSAMLRELAMQPDLEIKVFYGMDTTGAGSFDPGFGQHVTWDVPLLDGYDYDVLPSVLSAPAPGQWRPLNRGLGERLVAGRFDLVWMHGWGRLPDLLALMAVRRLGLPVLMRSENNFLGAPPRPGMLQGLKETLKHKVLASCDAFGYMGRAGHAYFRAYGVPESRLFDMPYMVDNAYWQQRADAAAAGRDELLARHDIPAGHPVVLFVGKFQPRKRLPDLIRAFAQVPAGAGRPAPYLLIVGSGEQGDAAQLLAREVGAERIRFAGFRNQGELPRYFELADVFVIPSANEQWGVVVNEAMNCACAIVASDECGSAPDLVIEGRTGFTFPTGDVAALSDRLATVLADPERLARMQRDARAHVNGFGADRILSGLRGAIGALQARGRLPAEVT